ncbi:MAG: phytoene desaturase family protein, partial [Minisyncoccota bacterium]
VIGGGVPGLTCAALLAGGGYRVLLAERSAQTGGLFRSRSASGFLFDLGPQVLLGARSGESASLYRQLGLDSELDLRRVGAGIIVDDLALQMPESLPAFISKLAQKFPADKRALYRFLDELEIEATAAPAGRKRDRSDWSGSTFAQLLDARFSDARTRAALAGLSLLAGETAARLPATVAARTISSFLNDGGYLVAGGSSSFSAALERRIRAGGGEISCGREVEAIDVTRKKPRRACGILLGGEQVRSESVVAATRIDRTLRMLPADSVPRSRLRSHERGEMGSSGFMVYLGLAGDLELPSHVFLTPGTPARLELGGVPVKIETVVLQVATIIDPSRARPGHHCVTLWAPIPGKAFHDEAARQGAGALERRLAGILKDLALSAIPDLRERTVFEDVASPITLAAISGSAGGPVACAQPAGEAGAPPSGLLPGLFLAGADTCHGSGASGAALSGRAAYRAMIGGDTPG